MSDFPDGLKFSCVCVTVVPITRMMSMCSTVCTIYMCSILLEIQGDRPRNFKFWSVTSLNWIRTLSCIEFRVSRLPSLFFRLLQKLTHIHLQSILVLAMIKENSSYLVRFADLVSFVQLSTNVFDNFICQAVCKTPGSEFQTHDLHPMSMCRRWIFLMIIWFFKNGQHVCSWTQTNKKKR